MPKPIWGTATSAHQVEGENRWNDWWAWEQAGKLPEPSGRACEHYQLFRQDFQLARSLGHTAHRFSLEWSRFEPNEGQWSEETFRHYDDVFDALRSEQLEPVVTLHHFTSPNWFAQTGGWLRKDAPEKFAVYVRKIAERYGRRVRYWITLNEPLIYIYQSFLIGRWPPGERSPEKAFRVLRQFIRAHVLAYQALHQYSKNTECWVSVAHHMTAFTPCRSNSLFDRISLFLRDWFVNRLIFEALLSGFLVYPGVFCERLPAKKTLDFLGINYYTRNFIRFDGVWGEKQFGKICEVNHHKTEIGEINDLGWEIYPWGIYQAVSSAKSFGLPIMISENGVCTKNDSIRQRFIQEHAAELTRAREKKIPIFGYFYWSLVDNFEWADGFSPRFGIVEVDYKTQSRRVRPSAQTLKDCCEKLFRT